jgi:hypothetical protein
MMEGSGSGSIPLSNGSGSGSRRLKKCGSGGSGAGPGSATLIKQYRSTTMIYDRILVSFLFFSVLFSAPLPFSLSSNNVMIVKIC